MLPSGIVTFLFTDIQGSTPRWERDPLAMQSMLEQHNVLLRASITENGGTVFKTVGDEFEAAFEDAKQAALAAIDAQRALAAASWDATGPLLVRMGLHTGHAVTSAEGDYQTTHTLNRVARIMSAAHGGQILLSRDTAEQVHDRLPRQVSLLDLGQHQLKGLTLHEHLFQLVVPDLRSDFPPLSSIRDTIPGTSPAPATPSISQTNAPLPLFVEDEVEVAGPAPVFVARERELAHLAGALESARGGEGQILLVTGGAGRGKSSLVQAFARQAQERDDELIVVTGSSNAHTGTGDPYLPFREALMMLTGDVEALWAGGRITLRHARRLWEMMHITVPALVEAAPELIGTFVPAQTLLERASTFAASDAGWFEQLAAITAADQRANLQQTRVHSQFASLLKIITAQRPVLLLLEDLHWADASSSDLLFYLSQQLSDMRILIAGTYRPEELFTSGLRRERHPMADIVSELKRRHGDIWLDLGGLAGLEGRQFVHAYLKTEPNRLSESFQESLYQHTGGHALFVVELLREMKQRGDLRRGEDGLWEESEAIDWHTFPAKVDGVIERRIGRLDEDLQSLLTVASVEGESFTAEVVARVQALDERNLVQRLSRELDKQHRLVTAQALERLGAQRLSLYRFRHQLFQHYLYNNLDDMERTYLHEEVGLVLEALYAEQSEQVAVQLARHFEEAGITEKAVTYLLQAGERALRLSTGEEAAVLLRKGLALLETLSEDPQRARRELDLQIALGNALLATKGYADPEVGDAYMRARELCRQLEDMDRLLPVMYGLWAYYFVLADYQKAQEQALEFLRLAESQKDAAVMVANRAVGWTYVMVGKVSVSLPYFEHIAGQYDMRLHGSLALLYGQEPGASGMSVGSLAMWLLGYPDQAQHWSDRALQIAEENFDPLGKAYALTIVAMYHQNRRDVESALRRSEEAIRLCDEYGFGLWKAFATTIHGWALAELEQPDQGIAQVRQGLDDAMAARASLFRPNFLSFLAQIHGVAGRTSEALGVVDEALALVEAVGVRAWEAELYRIKGELLRAQSAAPEEIEEHFQRALDVARAQKARSLELRATMSLCRLWQAQGKPADAHQLLQGSYDWFDEGFETADLQEAQALLEELKKDA